MEKLFMLVIIIGVGIISLKILMTWFLGSLSTIAKTNTNVNSNHIEYSVRSDDVEKCYLVIKEHFKLLLQSRQLSRRDMLAIRDYLYKNVHEYERKKYKNDAHAIYTMLKANDLTITHLYAIDEYLKKILNTGDVKNEKTICKN